MHQEGFGELWSLGFFRSKSLKLEVWKIWGMDVEMAPYLRKYKYLVKEVYWWNVVYCMGVWVVALGGAEVGVEKSFLIENLKMDIVVKQCVKVPFGQICSIWVCAKWVPKLWMLSEKSKTFDEKVTQIRATQIKATQIRATQIRVTPTKET